MKPNHGDFNIQSASLSSGSHKSDLIKTSEHKTDDILDTAKGIANWHRIPLESRKHTDFVGNNQQLSNSNSSASKKLDLNLLKFNSFKHAIDGFHRLEDKNTFLKIMNFRDEKAIGQNELYECCSCCLHRSAAEIHRYTYSRSRSSVYSERKKRRIVHGIGKHRTCKANHIRSDPCSCISKSPVLPKFKPNSLSKKLRTEKSELTPVHIRKKTEERGSKCKIAKNIEYQHNIANLFGSTSAQETKKTTIMNFFDGILSNASSSTHHFQINSFIKSSFYAMSLQIRHNNKKQLKLKPYECEPGVCVPGKCDPNECQKLIMKRLLENSSTMTSTGMRTKSRSSGIRDKHPHSKSQKQQHKEQVSKSKPAIDHHGFNYQILPKKHKRAVRIGSSFSFNIEFSKDTTGNTYKPTVDTLSTRVGSSTIDRNYKTKGTQGYKKGNRNGKSQSSTAAHHKGSMMTPKQERCFCTLKLQKRGVLQKKTEFKKRVVPTPNKFVSRSQNTNICDLDPNECEPNICVPGMCNPDECLEIIKKRNMKCQTRDFKGGEKSTKFSSFLQKCFCKTRDNSKGIRHTAAYSQTYRTNKLRKKRHKFHDVMKLKPYECEPGFCVAGQCNPQVCLERIKNRKKHAMSYTDTPGTKSMSTFSKPYKTSRSTYSRARIPKQNGQRKATKRVKEKDLDDYSSPKRNAVKIGSNFSFNIEFYKETTSENNVNEQLIEEKPRVKMMSRKTDGGREGRKTRSQGTSGPCSCRGIQTDAVKQRDKASAILKRCFCTLALHKETSTKKHKPKLKCVLISQGTESPSSKVIPDYKDAQNETRPYKLEPYECEQGVCTPGQCDPYECEKLIRKRLQREYGTSPPRRLVRSTVADSHRRKFRNQDAQSRFHHKPAVKKKQHLKTPNTHRRAVRIGSNFSFSIEFYKDTSLRPSTGTHNLQSSRTSNKKVQRIAHKRMKSKSVRSNQSKYIHRPSQIHRLRMESKASEISPLLKRCFCTLKLQKDGKQQTNKVKHKPMPSMIDVSIATENKLKPAIYKETGTKTRQMHRNLDPYECDPGSCVPGFCNPEECYERIKRRNSKTLGTETTQCVADCKPGACVSQQCDPEECLEKRSKTSGAGTDTSMMNSVSSVSNKRRPQTINVQIPMKRQQSRSPRQAVRIGSNFDFNVEFYKEKAASGDSAVIRNDSRAKSLRVKNKNVDASSSNRGVVKDTNIRSMLTDSETQVKQKTENKASAAENILKRCFCTAKLHQLETRNLSKRAITVARIDTIQNVTPFKLSRNYGRKIKTTVAKRKDPKILNEYLENQVLTGNTGRHHKEIKSSIFRERRSFVKLFYKMNRPKPEMLELKNFKLIPLRNNEVTKSINSILGQNLAKKTTVLMIGGINVNYNESQQRKDNAAARDQCDCARSYCRYTKTCSYSQLMNNNVCILHKKQIISENNYGNRLRSVQKSENVKNRKIIRRKPMERSPNSLVDAPVKSDEQFLQLLRQTGYVVSGSSFKLVFLNDDETMDYGSLIHNFKRTTSEKSQNRLRSVQPLKKIILGSKALQNKNKNTNATTTYSNVKQNKTKKYKIIINGTKASQKKKRFSSFLKIIFFKLFIHWKCFVKKKVKSKEIKHAEVCGQTRKTRHKSHPYYRHLLKINRDECEQSFCLPGCKCTLAFLKQIFTRKYKPPKVSVLVFQETNPDLKYAHYKHRSYECEPEACTAQHIGFNKYDKLKINRISQKCSKLIKSYQVKLPEKKWNDGDAQSIQKYVENKHQPCKTHKQVNHNEIGAHIGSNFSFSVEFYENKALRLTQSTPIFNHICFNSNVRNISQHEVMRSKSVTCDQDKYVNCQSQFDRLRIKLLQSLNGDEPIIALSDTHKCLGYSRTPDTRIDEPIIIINTVGSLSDRRESQIGKVQLPINNTIETIQQSSRYTANPRPATFIHCHDVKIDTKTNCDLTCHKENTSPNEAFENFASKATDLCVLDKNDSLNNNEKEISNDLSSMLVNNEKQKAEKVPKNNTPFNRKTIKQNLCIAKYQTENNKLRNEPIIVGRIDEFQQLTPFTLYHNNTVYQQNTRKWNKNKNSKAAACLKCGKISKFFGNMKLITPEMPNAKSVESICNGITKSNDTIFNPDVTKETEIIVVNDTDAGCRIKQQCRKIVAASDTSRNKYVKIHDNNQIKYIWKWGDMVSPCYKFTNEKILQDLENASSQQSVQKPQKSTHNKNIDGIFRKYRSFIIYYRKCINKMIRQKERKKNTEKIFDDTELAKNNTSVGNDLNLAKKTTVIKDGVINKFWKNCRSSNQAERKSKKMLFLKIRDFCSRPQYNSVETLFFKRINEKVSDKTLSLKDTRIKNVKNELPRRNLGIIRDSAGDTYRKNTLKEEDCYGSNNCFRTCAYCIPFKNENAETKIPCKKKTGYRYAPNNLKCEEGNIGVKCDKIIRKSVVVEAKRRKTNMHRYYRAHKYKYADTCTYCQLVKEKSIPNEHSLVGDGPDNNDYSTGSMKVFRNIKNCQNLKRLCPKDLETILPYMPRKFPRRSKIRLNCKYKKNQIAHKTCIPRNSLKNKQPSVLHSLDTCCPVLSKTKRQDSLRKSIKEKKIALNHDPKASICIKSTLNDTQKTIYKNITYSSLQVENTVQETPNAGCKFECNCKEHYKTRQSKRVKFALTPEVFTVTEFYSNFKGLADFDVQECAKNNRKSILNSWKKCILKNARKGHTTSLLHRKYKNLVENK